MRLSCLFLALSIASTSCLELRPSQYEPTATGDTETGSQTSATDIPTDPDSDEDSDSAANPCAEWRCPKSDRPSPDCKDGKLVVYLDDGVCVADGTTPRCEFPGTEIECLGAPCAEGKCPNALCQAMACDTPPGAYCKMTGNLGIWRPRGRCTNLVEGPVCLYDEEERVCPSGCVDATAQSPAHCRGAPCDGVVCSTPPARYCEGNFLVVWNHFGRCGDDGSCLYDSRKIPCDQGCEAGACLGEPCAHVMCLRPPAPFCAGGSGDSSLQIYDPNGTCTEGACVYERRSLPCVSCDKGRCADEPCYGTTCGSPPAPYCDAEGSLTFWNSLATCSPETGTCEYDQKTDECEGSGGCLDGRCNDDPCVGAQPTCSLGVPAAYCDGATSVSYPPSDQGECGPGGACVPVPLETECAGACSRGECL